MSPASRRGSRESRSSSRTVEAGSWRSREIPKGSRTVSRLFSEARGSGVGSGRRADDGLSTDRLLELFEELAGFGTLFLTFTGGEVLLRRDWLLLARRARRLGFSLRLFSNGSLIDEEVVRALQDLSIGVEVSLYSTRARVFERITGCPGSLQRT